MKQVVFVVIFIVMSVSYTAFAEEWILCAREGQKCLVPGTKTVSYGSGDKWVTKPVKYKVFCGNSVFGDPAPGVEKACYYQENSSSRLPGRDRGFRHHWVKCADEGQNCRFYGKTEVKYGAGNLWANRTVTDGVHCGNDAFGDPAPGVNKACYYKESPAPKRGFRSHWEKCADEGHNCRFYGQAEVRYGASDRWSNRIVTDGVYCGNNAFGDPAPGVVKACYIKVE